MIISSGLTFENFSRQSGFNAEFVLARDFDITNNLLFGLSGSSVLSYKINSGRIFDSNNLFLHSVNYDTSTKLNIQVTSGVSVFQVNDKPIQFISGITGYFDNIFFSGELETNIGFTLYGEAPILSFEQLNNFSGLNNIITGKITNTTPARVFKITGAYITDNSDFVSVSGFTTGEISNTGHIYLEAETGISYPSGNIGLTLETNFGNISYILDADSNDVIIFDEYLQLYPGINSIFSTLQDSEFSVISFFSTGDNRQLDVRLEHVSGCTFAPINVQYQFESSGYLTKQITGGTGLLTGTVTGYFTGGTGATTSGYSEIYAFTGNYTGTHTTTATGLHGTGVSVTGLISSGYNVTLNSGDSGIINIGQGTGLITGIYTALSGEISQDFSFGPSGVRTDFANGYTGTLNNSYSGSRSFNYSSASGFYYSFGVNGITFPELESLEFQLARWVHNSSGDPSGTLITGIESTFYGPTIDYSNYSTISGAVTVYTGFIEFESYPPFGEMCSENTSGYYEIYIGQTEFNQDMSPFPLSGNVWAIDHFTITNFPVNDDQVINSTGTGIYPIIYVTGDVSKFVSGVIMHTGVTEYPGQATFSDVWNLKTGFNNLNYIDYKYNNLFTTSVYHNNSGTMLCTPNNRNSFFIEVDYNGFSLSGYTVAKLILNDGTLSGEYLISGKGEFYV